jgi:hypothetical protein
MALIILSVCTITRTYNLFAVFHENKWKPMDKLHHKFARFTDTDDVNNYCIYFPG